MDAIFGLPRKKSTGSSYRSPLYEDLFYLDQGAVDQYVNDYPKPKALTVVSGEAIIIIVTVK